MKFCGGHKNIIAIMALSFGISFGFASNAEITWKSKYYNPVPLADDLVLPMPCGGAMVFRKISTPNTDGAIGDVDIILGQEDNDQPYLNGLRKSYVSGAFSDTSDDSKKGYFYLAKYELSEPQYNAVMGECAGKSLRKRDFSPSVGQAKLDYEIFAEKYTIWLMNNAIDLLPTAGDTQAYLRLPTEAEWEFSVRGGLAVEKAAFRALLPVIEDGLDHNEFIAHGGSDSAGGKIQVIGTLKANPLGLHDMLGNVGEIVSSPFSLVRHGRMHGQVGGYVKRGGDARTPLSSITSATRYEVPPFDVISLTKTTDSFTGTRLAIAGLAITSRKQANDLKEALNRLTEIDSALATAETEEEVIRLVTRLEKEAETPRAKSQLALIRNTINRSRAERNSQRDKSIRLILESSTLICSQAVQRYINAIAMQLLLQNLLQLQEDAFSIGDTTLIEEVRVAIVDSQNDLAELEAIVKEEIVEYANVIEGLTVEYSMELLNRQSANIKDSIIKRGERRYNCLGAMGPHLATRKKAGFSDLDLIGDDFQGIAMELAQ